MTVLPQSRVRVRAPSRRLAGSHSRIVAEGATTHWLLLLSSGDLEEKCRQRPSAPPTGLVQCERRSERCVLGRA
jgi:hypothetical protein